LYKNRLKLEENKMRKYDINVCKCGVIHAIPNEKIEKALKKQKPLLTICGNCGVASLRGGDEDVDFDGNPCYMMYRRDFTYNDSESINKDNIDQYSEVYYDKGYKVMMNSGMYATDYENGRFSDCWYPEFYKIQRSDVTVDEIMEFIKKYHKDRSTVNMNQLISSIPDDVLEELSNYWIEGLDWTGTKYQKEWS
jgi:hypothetical protein